MNDSASYFVVVMLVVLPLPSTPVTILIVLSWLYSSALVSASFTYTHCATSVTFPYLPEPIFAPAPYRSPDVQLPFVTVVTFQPTKTYPSYVGAAIIVISAVILYPTFESALPLPLTYVIVYWFSVHCAYRVSICALLVYLAPAA